MLIKEKDELKNYGGLDYLSKLTSQISKFTDYEFSKNKKAFIYRKINLRFAVERELFYKFMNDCKVIHSYRDLNKRYNFNNEIINGCNTFILTGLGVISSQKKILKNFFILKEKLKCIYRELRILIADQKNFYPKNYNNFEVLIHIKHKKFFRYFDRIESHLEDVSYAYLVTTDKNLALELIKMGKPVVQDFGHYFWPGWLLTFGPLSGFIDLISIAEKILFILKSIKPKCVVVMEGNAAVDVIISETGKTLGIPTVCVQQGWCPIIHTGFQNMEFESMFVWGDKFEVMLKPFNPKQRFVVSGSHALQKLRKLKMTASLNSDKLISVGFFLQSPGVLLPKDVFEKFNLFILDLALHYPDNSFFVREHPSYPISEQLKHGFSKRKNIILMPPDLFSLETFFKKINLSVSIYSTSILESIAAGIVPLICSVGELASFYPNIASEGMGIEVKNLDDAKKWIEKIILNPNLLNLYEDNIISSRSEYFSETNSAEFIAEKIKDLAKI